jgi:hypothetical protein
MAQRRLQLAAVLALAGLALAQVGYKDRTAWKFIKLFE